MLSLNPLCADLVRAEIDDIAIRDLLIVGLETSFQIFQQLHAKWQSDDFEKSLDADAITQLTKTQKRMLQLQEALEHELFGNENVERHILFVAADIAQDYEAKTGREYGFMESIDLLRKNLLFSELIIDETIQTCRKRRGGPVDLNRDFLIGLISATFRTEAPLVPRTHETSSLFFEVVAQFEADLLLSEDNLSRRIKRVLGKEP